MADMRIDVWSDVVCPWCRLGQAHLEEALRREGIDAQIAFHAFELDPTFERSEPLLASLARKFGSEARVRQAWARLNEMGARVGLRYEWDKAIGARTFDAHRVIHHAGLQGRDAAMHERITRAHFVEGLDVADHATLAKLAAETGVDGAAEALASGAHADAVRADERAARELGIGGVPFFVLDGKLAVSGAQPIEVFQRAIRQAQGAPAT